MSEIVKITIVMDDDKTNTQIDTKNASSVIMTHDTSKTLMSTLLQNNLINGSFCGGRGDCGRCRIQFQKGATAPTALERSVLEPEGLRQGYRLACLAKPKDDCVIKLALVDVPKVAVVTDMIGMTENDDCTSQYNLQTQKHKSYVMESERDALITVDLGTTTIAMQLMAIDTGEVIDTYCEMNPQRRYGADVLSRIQASCDGNREALQRLAVEVLERGVARFQDKATDIKCMCIAGNTTMEHLLMGYDVSSLGHSPFTPVEIGLQEYKHPGWDFAVWLVPGISAFVGGDIVAGLYACGILPVKYREGLARHFVGQDSQDKQVRLCSDYADNIDGSGTTLFIDLGTNGEMAITDGKHMIVTATAAGPAFEGGANAGIVGSDMIACTAELLRQGILDETGLLAEPYFTEGVSVQSASDAEVGRSFEMSEEDIRSLQMAKAAVRAGVEILLKRLSEPQPGDSQDICICLAGGFGYYLDVEAAFRIGLLPEYMRGHVRSVGNTSLMGAYLIGRDLWQHRVDKQTLEQSLSSIESINLAEQKEFQKLYIQYMNFEAC